MVKSRQKPLVIVEVPAGYEQLGRVLCEALAHAALGKGKERHATEDPFEQQIGCSIVRWVGHGHSRGQAIKKIVEAGRLPKEQAISELLGAINYIAADILVLEEE